MPESLYALALLACPLGMGAMMWLMMRGKKQQPAAPSQPLDRGSTGYHDRAVPRR